MYIYFTNCLHAVAVNALGEYQIPSNMKKRTICSVVGFRHFYSLENYFGDWDRKKFLFFLHRRVEIQMKNINTN